MGFRRCELHDAYYHDGSVCQQCYRWFRSIVSLSLMAADMDDDPTNVPPSAFPRLFPF